MGAAEAGSQGWSAHLPRGGDVMKVYEALSLMIVFSMLIVTVLSFHKRK